MNLRQLEYFLAVVEAGGFSRAADEVHVVQSGLSTAIQQLERELGVTLLDRTTRRVRVTDAGAVLAIEARRILAAVETARDAVAAVAGGLRGVLRIGVMHSLLPVAVADSLTQLHKERPGVQLRPQTKQDGAAGLIRGVEDDELDIAFATAHTDEPRSVKLTRLSVEDMVLICPRTHRWNARRDVRLADLADEPFIDVPLGWGSRASTDRLCSARGIRRRIEIEVGDVATVVDLVRAGLGIAIVAPSSAPPLTDVAVVTLTPTPRFETFLVLPKNRPVRPAADALARLVLDRTRVADGG
ncbi:LysR family transcriptional regulator [Rudaeicoccus suwonensis]|uniref:LysR family transcriptional regulator n=1 Tax=Rudaeicoccus suwonensis TaxID=657409 RepID=A0A561E825_9MICO|nr:LysR family transcriptional regulator [Rudaeicoccus suwonensis]TWE11768.1 LysR family transcriptional regulator [Rudaeicoccus suwonensis]